MRLLVLLLFISLGATAQRVKVTAHRGASGYAPENTFSAIRKALEIGVDRIEVDVQQTADGEIVCLHDKKLNRTTDTKGKVKKFTYAELQQVNAHHTFKNDFPNEKIPLLRDVFELMDGATEFVIEIKAGRSYYPGIEDSVANMITRYEAERWALVHSFNDRVLEYLDDHHPNIRLQKLFVSKPIWLPLMLDFRLHFASLKDYDYLEGFGVSKGGVDARLVRKVHEIGKVLHVWTVNKPEDIAEMLELGVDGIISNYPDRVKAQLRR
ncbi:MAG: glycerophosphodiester phosphodiesterase [Flavobacteriales bacterium]|nr:glycerophosphodiester phosphodiesterase [Flavobacteriales bacterium]MCB9203854.1 glycerophosphodiester phosphodiesterase [Flavobacteriales bacterium]